MKKINKRINCENKIIRIFTLGILTLFIFSIFTLNINVNATEDIKWEVKLSFKETGGVEDYVIIGEAPNARDGPPKDNFDMPKPPPAPISPYIQIWLNDNLTAPYNSLLADYRDFPDNYKVWNISGILKTQVNTSKNITILWDIQNMTDFEYDSLKLYILGDSEPVADLLVDNSYSTLFNANVLHQFQIISKKENSDGNIDTINTTTLILIIVLIIVAIIVSVIIYWRNKR